MAKRKIMLRIIFFILEIYYRRSGTVTMLLHKASQNPLFPLVADYSVCNDLPLLLSLKESILFLSNPFLATVRVILICDSIVQTGTAACTRPLFSTGLQLTPSFLYNSYS